MTMHATSCLSWSGFIALVLDFKLVKVAWFVNDLELIALMVSYLNRLLSTGFNYLDIHYAYKYFSYNSILTLFFCDKGPLTFDDFYRFVSIRK